VSSDEDLLLQKRLSLLRNVSSTVDDPPPIGWQVLEEVIALQPDPSTTVPSVVVPGGSSSGVSTTAELATVVKTVDDAAVVSTPAGDVAAVRKATYEAVLMKETAVKTVVDPVAPGRTPTPTVSAKRVATPSGSTPPTKHPYKCV
jgi:hypothetical protein